MIHYQYKPEDTERIKKRVNWKLRYSLQKILASKMLEKDNL